MDIKGFKIGFAYSCSFLRVQLRVLRVQLLKVQCSAVQCSAPFVPLKNYNCIASQKKIQTYGSKFGFSANMMFFKEIG